MKDERDIAQLCARGGASGRARSARVPNASAAMLPRIDGFTETAFSLHALALLALVSTTVFTGCSREPAAEPQPDINRMHDAAYTNKLAELRAAQKEISRRMASVARELEEARKENPESEKTKELERREKEIVAELEKQRMVSMAVIRARMTQEMDEKEAAEKKTKEKK